MKTRDTSANFMLKIAFATAIVTILFALSVNGAVSGTNLVLGAPPTDGGFYIQTSAGLAKFTPNSNKSGAGIHANDSTPQMAVVSVRFVLMPVITSPSWATAANMLIADELGGRIPANAMPFTMPTMYSVLTSNMISWTNLFYSQSTPLWAAVLNPPSPFQAELGGPILEEIITGQSLSGGDDISLDGLSVTITTSDGGALNGTMSFTGLSYTAQAPLIMADGTTNMSAPASTMGNKFIVIVQSRLFNGGATQGGLNSVQSWVNGHVNYSVTCAAIYGGDSRTMSVSTASVNGLPNITPILSLVNSGGGVGWLTVANADTNRYYRVYESSVLGGQGSLVTTPFGTNASSVSLTNSAGFFTAQQQ